jgi:regulator of sigma E protease
VPIGGYVKIYGEDGNEEKEKSEPLAESKTGKKMSDAPRRRQAVILSAGVLGNLIFAWLLLSIGFMVGLPTSPGGPFSSEIKEQRLVVTDVLPASPALKAGIKQGDQILSLQSGNKSLLRPNGEAASIFISALPAGSPVVLTLLRQKATTTISASVEEGVIAERRGIGIAMEDAGILKLSFPKAIVAGIFATVSMTKSVAVGIIGLLGDAFRGEARLSSLTGPVGIAIMVGDAEKLGLLNLLLLTVLISINLAVINIIPFPALDGGRLFFLAIEAIIRKPLNPKFARRANQIGFVLLISLMAVITYKDIIKLIK